jgi:hypothetical protein
MSSRWRTPALVAAGIGACALCCPPLVLIPLALITGALGGAAFVMPVLGLAALATGALLVVMIRRRRCPQQQGSTELANPVFRGSQPEDRSPLS